MKYTQTIKLSLLLLVFATTAIAVHADWKMKPVNIKTRWAADVSPSNAHPEYPRPQMVRSEWQSLNGLWKLAKMTSFDSELPQKIATDVLVPYPIESALSGVKAHYEAFCYQRTFTVPEKWNGQRVLLHFEAVDWQCEVIVNGQSVGSHKGGYDPFTFDITDALTSEGPQDLVVKVYDPTNHGSAPRGKQSLSPGGIMYTCVSGIWQSVWLEAVPQSYIEDLVITPDIDASMVSVGVESKGKAASFSVEVIKDGQVVATGEASIAAQADVKVPSPELWSPEHPFLYDLRVTLLDAKGQPVDCVDSYFGMRKISIERDATGYVRTMLNNKFVFQMGPLDQGFWPEGIYTAPTDEALMADIVAMKRYGFNMVRKHIKVEPRRWYYWCDKLGLMVWQDMPSSNSYASNPPELDKEQFAAELEAMIRTHKSIPCIIMWVLFNEGCAQHDTEALVSKIRELDPTRLVNEASGWTHHGAGDIKDIHPYPAPTLTESKKQATACGEYGGVKYTLDGHLWSPSGSWGYASVASPEELDSVYLSYSNRLARFRLKGMSAAVYTQLTDVEIEINGLMSYDRIPKSDINRIHLANRLAIEGEPTLEDFILPTADIKQQMWRYTTTKPTGQWYATDFNDAAWKTGLSGFGANGLANMTYGTKWTTNDIWLRKTVELDINDDDLRLLKMMLYYDEATEVYLNGVKILSTTGYSTDYTVQTFTPEARAALNPHGENVFAIHTNQTSGGQFVDLGLFIDHPIKTKPEPTRQIDMTIAYSDSKELSFTIGYSTDLTSETMMKFQTFTRIPFASQNMDASGFPIGLDGTALSIPTNLTFDVSQLTASIPANTPVKYFVRINTTEGATGQGRIESCQLVDRLATPTGLTIPFTPKTLSFTHEDNCLLTTVVQTDEFAPVRNVGATGNTITWQAPHATTLPIVGYAVFANDEKIATLPATTYRYEAKATADALYAVAALYADGLSPLSPKVMIDDETAAGTVPDNVVRYFNKSGFNIPLGLKAPLEAATIEYWIKPETLVSYNQQIGPGFSSFAIRCNANRQITAGWENTTDNRVLSSTGVLTVGKWTHVAVVIDGPQIMLYIDGQLHNSCTSTAHSGFPSIEQLTFGSNSNGLSGRFDEVRVWNYARTARQIADYMGVELPKPATQSGLLAYYRMDFTTIDGVDMLRDRATGLHATLFENAEQTAEVDNQLLAGGELSASFRIVGSRHYPGEEIKIEAELSPAVTRTLWDAPEAGLFNTAVDGTPTLIYNEVGTYTVMLNVYDRQGNPASAEKRTVTILPTTLPTPDFSIATDKTVPGRAVQMINCSKPAPATTYKWLLPGATTETIEATHANAIYTKPGTYTITLCATNSAGTSTVEKQITVTDGLPEVAFSVDPSVIVLGDCTYLNDSTTGAYTNAVWHLDNGVNQTDVVGGSSSFTPTETGVYNVARTAEGVDGAVTVAQPSALFVCTGQSRLGLQFNGKNERITIPTPFADTYKKATIDWWMRPDTLAGIAMGSSNGTCTITVADDGTMSVAVSSKVIKSPQNFVIPGEWHHYTISYGSMHIYFYRDGVKMADGNTSTSYKAWDDFVIGGSEPMYAVFDEFSIWSERLDATQISEYANKAINASAQGLVRYYQFNELAATNLYDGSENRAVATATGFDATTSWINSAGVFALADPTQARQREDVTMQYLTNAKAPFKHSDEVVNTAIANNFYELLSGTEESTWEGAIMEGIADEGVYIDARYNYSLSAATGWNGFGNALYNQPFYQTTQLPAGYYQLDVTTENAEGTDRVYIVATAADTLSGISELQKTLAYAPVAEGSIRFSLTEDAAISLGLLYNMSAFSQLHVTGFTLYREPIVMQEADGLNTPTAIHDTIEANRIFNSRTLGNGKLQLRGNGHVRIYSIAGQCVYDANISGAITLALTPGIYIINNQKVIIK